MLPIFTTSLSDQQLHSCTTKSPIIEGQVFLGCHFDVGFRSPAPLPRQFGRQGTIRIIGEPESRLHSSQKAVPLPEFRAGDLGTFFEGTRTPAKRR